MNARHVDAARQHHDSGRRPIPSIVVWRVIDGVFDHAARDLRLFCFVARRLAARRDAEQLLIRLERDRPGEDVPGRFRRHVNPVACRGGRFGAGELRERPRRAAVPARRRPRDDVIVGGGRIARERRRRHEAPEDMHKLQHRVTSN